MMGDIDSALKMIHDMMRVGDISEGLNCLKREIEHCMIRIRQTKNVECSRFIFTELLKAQTEIAKLMFKEHMAEYVAVPEWLWTFVRDFDRADDIRWQSYLYTKIKEGNYPFDE